MPLSPRHPRRPLRVLFVANDGLSVGHVTRALAIARALERGARARDVSVAMLLATTSEAHALLDAEPALATVRLPAPASARRANLSDPERRRLVSAAVESVASAFAPDLMVVDTFPSGPHGELARIRGRRRVLVRRSVPEERLSDPTLTEGLDAYEAAIVAGDPDASPASQLPIRDVVHVPPITLTETADALPRDEARDALGLPREGRAVLVASGGGGDAEASARALAIARAVRAAEPGTIVAIARGPLARDAGGATALDRAGDVGDPPARVLRRAVLAPLLRAFDGAFAAAGYNTAHELAKARVPAALFARPRPFDDQAARAERFAARSLARVLDVGEVHDEVRDALAWMRTASIPELEAGGAARAAEALLDRATGGARRDEEEP